MELSKGKSSDWFCINVSREDVRIGYEKLGGTEEREVEQGRVRAKADLPAPKESDRRGKYMMRCSRLYSHGKLKLRMTWRVKSFCRDIKLKQFMVHAIDNTCDEYEKPTCHGKECERIVHAIRNYGSDGSPYRTSMIYTTSKRR